MTGVILYSRPGCHLCDDARALLRSEQVPFEEIDIDRDDELLKRYLVRIPVISIDGDDALELIIDPAALRARMESRKPSPDAGQR